MKKKRKVIIIWVILAVVVAGLASLYFIRGRQIAFRDGLPQNAIWADIQTAHTETIVSSISANGTVELSDRVTVYPATQAKLVTVPIAVGDTVTAGQIIATYDPKGLDNLKDQLRDAQLVLESARLGLKSAELGLQNVTLPPSEAEMLQVEASVKQSEKTITDISGQVDQSDINIDQLERSLTKAETQYDKIKILYQSGVSTKSELDSAYDAIVKLQDQIKTAKSQRDGLYRNLAAAEDSLDLSRKQYNALINRAEDAKVQIQSGIQQVQTDVQAVQIQQAQRNIDKIQKQINEYTLEERAPVSGTVLTLGYGAGETASAAKALCAIADISRDNLKITVYIPENDAAHIALGQPVEIKGGALGDTVYQGKVAKIFPLAEKKQIGSSTETAITVEVGFADAAEGIKAGYTVETVIIMGIRENAVVIPLMSTLLESDGTNYVYVVRDDSTVEKRTVKLLAYSDLNVEAEGIAVGERVVNNPDTAIREGSYVRQIDESHPNYRRSQSSFFGLR